MVTSYDTVLFQSIVKSYHYHDVQFNCSLWCFSNTYYSATIKPNTTLRCKANSTISQFDIQIGNRIKQKHPRNWLMWMELFSNNKTLYIQQCLIRFVAIMDISRAYDRFARPTPHQSPLYLQTACSM